MSEVGGGVFRAARLYLWQMQNNSTDKHLKIGSLAKLSGLSERTLRHYEGLGIITPIRSDGGTRLYRESDVEVARVAQRMRDLDIPVEIIREIATRRRDYPTGDQSSTAMIEMLEDLADKLGDRAAKTLSLQDELTRTVRLLRGCRGCQNRPDSKNCPECPMEKSPERSSVARLIWQPE